MNGSIKSVPGEPQEVQVAVLNSTSVRVTWKPPKEKEKHGVILGYQFNVQETRKTRGEKVISDPGHYLELNGSATAFTIADLQPDTKYQVQVSAMTRKGDGARSKIINFATPGGVPSRPTLKIRLAEGTSNGVSIEASWSQPKETFGKIVGWRLKYGKRLPTPSQQLFGVSPQAKPEGQTDDMDELSATPTQPPPITEINIDNPDETRYVLQELEKGYDYEFRLAARNAEGHGQESVAYITTPDGPPTGPPTNIQDHTITPDILVVTWDPPEMPHRNGRIIGYTLQFHKRRDDYLFLERNVTNPKVVIQSLEEDTWYYFRIRAYTSRGPGPWSENESFKTIREIVRAPLNVRAMATSESSVEVWWEEVPGAERIVGYRIYYTMMATEDLDTWLHKDVPATFSAEIQNLERHTSFAINVAAKTKEGYLGRLSETITVKTKPQDVPMWLVADSVSTHTMDIRWEAPRVMTPMQYRIAFDAVKEFVDAGGMTQRRKIPARVMLVGPDVYSKHIEDLTPFTTYSVNVTAIPKDSSFRPPARIQVTTMMAAPKTMVKPDSLGVTTEGYIFLALPQASEEYGPISHYFLVVVPERKNYPFKHPDAYLLDDLIVNKGRSNPYLNSVKPGEFEEEEELPYIAAKFLNRDIPVEFYLGNNKTYNGFWNRPLSAELRYKIFLRAFVDTPQKTNLYGNSELSDFMSLKMPLVHPGQKLPTRPPPSSPHVDPEGIGHPDMTPYGIDGVHARSADKVWIIAPAVSVVLLVALVCAVILLRRRRGAPKEHDAGRSAVDKPLLGNERGAVIAGGIGGGSAYGGSLGRAGSSLGGGNYDYAPGGPSDPVELRRLNFQTPGMMSHPPIPVSELSNHIEMLKANNNTLFSQEYESIETGQLFKWENSSMEVNKPKNRYANVIAYDHSRVILEPIDGIPGSDYINANFCDGYRKQNAYIATQGPLPETVSDFWRMVWEQRSMTIVMMTKLEERARIKCDQYWPSRGTETYHPIIVSLVDTVELATYIIRTFQVQHLNYSEIREVRQFQFTAWPDHGVPVHPTPFLVFLKRIKGLNPSEAGPPIIHCSAGVGRTGAYIVIDSMLERMKTEHTVDIYGHVTCLRAQRNYMVQTEDQYVFIHDALAEAVICGNSEIPARNLQLYVQKLFTPEPDGQIPLELEFKRLANMKAQPSRFVSANMPFNKHKNRLVNILPYENTRVCLQHIMGKEGSDYINASYIDGYKYPNAYIATQGPLPDTAEDFWRMLWEHNSTIVVMLTKLREMGREKCHQYWPNDRCARYSFCVVEPIAEYNMPQYILREFKVTDARDGQSRTIRQFQFTDWPEQGVPKSGEGFIDFIGQVHKTKEQFGQEGPITVHCSAGVGRTGVFVTLSIVLERMQYEGVVDLFTTVRILRTQRPAMVQTENGGDLLLMSSLLSLSDWVREMWSKRNVFLVVLLSGLTQILGAPQGQLSSQRCRAPNVCVELCLCRKEDIVAPDDPFALIVIKEAFSSSNDSSNPVDICFAEIGFRQDGSEVVPVGLCPETASVCCRNPLSRKKEPPTELHTSSKDAVNDFWSACGRVRRNGPGYEIKFSKATPGIDFTEAKPWEFPWTAVILEKFKKTLPDGQNLDVFLGAGSVINPKVVLTAATKLMKFRANEKKELVVRVGAWDLYGRSIISSDVPHQDLFVEKIIFHPDFQPFGQYANNLAVLLLKESISPLPNVGTICLPEPGGHLIEGYEESCIATGFGTPDKGISNIMKKAYLNLIPNSECNAALIEALTYPDLVLHRGSVCAVGSNGLNDTCKGDGGGPLACLSKGTGRWTQVGITAWGVDCSGAHPGVYTNVLYYLDWIHSVIV
ncbi:unnamed protein product [Notodromas monacha]|uniref:Protein-tyrosine-phosphatase n=1 Tax=Notodromas monacha TaxID=399045 RepID=A0A7R9BS53_9CRUS|nr:unnamed protein product [Notodromas monacha]CAG0919767.1 unnamed protein product [Notodromas monacha]